LVVEVPIGIQSTNWYSKYHFVVEVPNGIVVEVPIGIWKYQLVFEVPIGIWKYQLVFGSTNWYLEVPIGILNTNCQSSWYEFYGNVRG
jgi:hypothetical protein